MILFQVKDLAAKACGEPHIAPTWEIAKASLGAILAKTSELAERAQSILIEYCGDWDPQDGITEKTFQTSRALDREWSCFGHVCLAEFRAACAKEENDMQWRADNLTDEEKQEIHERQCEVSNILDAAERRKK